MFGDVSVRMNMKLTSHKYKKRRRKFIAVNNLTAADFVSNSAQRGVDDVLNSNLGNAMVDELHGEVNNNHTQQMDEQAIAKHHGQNNDASSAQVLQLNDPTIGLAHQTVQYLAGGYMLNSTGRVYLIQNLRYNLKLYSIYVKLKVTQEFPYKIWNLEFYVIFLLEP